MWVLRSKTWASLSFESDRSDREPQQQKREISPPPYNDNLGMDFWWMSSLHSNPEALAELSMERPRRFVFPPQLKGLD